MKFYTYFILISYLMAGTGLIAVSLTNVISPVFLAGISGIAILSFFLSIQGKPFNIPVFIWNSIAVIILAAGLMDYLFISRSLADVSERFLTILMIAKLFDLKTNRDYAMLYILTFFQLLAASALTVNISFLFVLALYILAGIWALTIFTLKRDWEEKAAPHKEMAKNILGPYFFIATAGLAALSLIITLFLFFIIPRMGVGFFPKKTSDTVKISGFAEKIDLGDIGQIKLDPTIVMRVELPGYKASAVSNLHFRGISFDAYNGTQWQQTIKELTPLERDSGGIWRVKGAESQRVKETEILTQTILLEPIETNVLFAASGAIGVSGNFRNIIADRTGSLYLPSPSYSRIEYTAYSILPPPPKAVLPEEDLGTDLEKIELRIKSVPTQYLHIPPGLERVSNLARDIAALEKTPFEKAAAIEKYLKNNYRYTLTPGKGAGKNPAEDFLFYTKAGYCEQYATAMAMMLRAIGIPSRLVTGFMPGEWNKFGNYFIIRGRDAHSWVEGYIPGSGWLTFDPTPSAETAAGIIPAATPVITLYIDMLKWKWNRYIVDYSFKDQMNIAKAIETNMRSLVTQTFRFDFFKAKALSYKWKDMLIFVTAAVIAAIILIIITRIVWKPKGRAKWPKAPFFYKDMLRLLAKKGKIKKYGETALEFADAVNIKEAQAITQIYYDVRFGGYKLTDNEKDKISVYLTAINKAELESAGLSAESV